MQLILSQLQLILAQPPSLVANNPGSEESLLLVGGDLIAGSYTYTFIIWHQLIGGFRRIWSKRPLKTFSEALEAFRTAITDRFLNWIQENWDVFVAYKASFGYILA